MDRDDRKAKNIEGRNEKYRGVFFPIQYCECNLLIRDICTNKGHKGIRNAANTAGVADLMRDVRNSLESPENF